MNLPKPFDAQQARRVHLSHLLDHVSSPTLESYPPSFIEPCVYWSSVEKATFFASLARHSRWKPDLIAEDIGGGKTAADVCSYIELLEQASAHNPRKRCKREAYPIAHEISEEWITVENDVSGELTAKEPEWQEAALKRKRAQELQKVKNSFCRGKEAPREIGGEGADVVTTSQSAGRKRPGSETGETEGWEAHFKARKQAFVDLWKREDLLSTLDRRFLKTMDRMLRTLENTTGTTATAEGNQGHHEDIEHDRHAQFENLHPHVDPSSVNVGMQVVSNANDMGSSVDHVGTDRQYHRVASPSSHLQPTFAFPSQTSAPGPLGAQDSERRFLPSSYSLADRTRQTTPPFTLPNAELCCDLSPDSRRRLRKRLWARRKRAMEQGLPVSEVSMDTVRLKRGRKAKHKAQNAERVAKTRVSETQGGAGLPAASPQPALNHDFLHSDIQDEPAEDQDEGTDGSELAPTRKPYGWAKLRARQVTGATLRTDGIDLFHLEKFASVMSLLAHIHTLSTEADPIDEPEDSSEADEGPSTLSYPFLRLLRACVVRFVTCLVAYVILHKEIETRQKQRIRDIFHTGGAKRIRSENVHEALLLMGKDTSTAQFFKKMKRIVKNTLIMQSEDDESSSSVSPDPSDLSSTETHSAWIRLVFQSPSTRDDPHAPPPLSWNPGIPTTSLGKAGDSLLPEEIDEAGIGKELRDEEKIEEIDRKADQMHEQDLWMDIGLKRREQDDLVMAAGTNQPVLQPKRPQAAEPLRRTTIKGGKSNSLRFRRPGGALKSRVYIDSDEDL